MPHLLVERIRSVPQLLQCSVASPKEDPVRGAVRSGGSFLVEALDILVGMVFLAGSVCFLPSYGDNLRTFLTGCLLFIVGGALQLCLSVFTGWEAWRSRGWCPEAKEHAFYVVGSLLFLAGTVLYWPEEAKHTHVEWIKGLSLGVYFNLFTPEFEGTLLFIVGSLLFAMAAFVNALSCYAFSQASQSFGSRLLLATTSLYIVGSLLFVLGSVAFLPHLGWGDHMEAFGASCFITGSALYVAGGLASLLRTACVDSGEQAPIAAAAAHEVNGSSNKKFPTPAM
mmetsp:Transcript_145621/g.363234  ORF Transcript_145621/g.363234 Transcript_145621/m.363234 type:complete len:282 (-) Transcript_145621:3-848(-)